MDIYLIRHGRAEPRSDEVEDAARELTDEGRERLGTIAAALDRMGVRFDLVLTSPWRRAADSAEYLRNLGEPEIRSTPHLAAPPSPALLAEIEGDAVALVGHEPWMSELVAWLATGDPGNAGAFVMKKGGIARLAGKPRPGGARLVWLVPPAAVLSLVP